MKFQELANIQYALFKCGETPQKVIGYAVMRNKKPVDKKVQEIADLQKQIFELHAEKNDKGKAKTVTKRNLRGEEYEEYIIDETKRAEYDAKIKELNEDDSHKIEWYKILESRVKEGIENGDITVGVNHLVPLYGVIIVETI